MQNSIIVPDTLAPNLITALTLPPIKVKHHETQEIQSAIATISQTQRPSTLAGIVGPLFPSVIRIDDAFNTALESYKRRLINASAKDFALESLPIGNPTFYAGFIGATNALSCTPDIPVIREICVPIFAFFGFFWGMCNRSSIIEEKKNEDKSINRKKWATWVSFEEEKRIEDCLTLVRRRVNVLAGEIQESHRNGFLEQDSIDEIRQISAVIETISGTSLTVGINENQISVNIFLAQFV